MPKTEVGKKTYESIYYLLALCSVLPTCTVLDVVEGATNDILQLLPYITPRRYYSRCFYVSDVVTLVRQLQDFKDDVSLADFKRGRAMMVEMRAQVEGGIRNC
jgi:hypothetical protein